MFRVFASLALATLLPTQLLPAQRTIQVSGGGSALSQAVAAAMPGDTLDVLPGIYRYVHVDKGLNLLFRPGAVIQADPGIGGLQANGIPVGQRLVIHGLSFLGTTVFGPLTIGPCAGTVVLDDCDLAGSSFVSSRITQCTGPVIARNLFDRNGPVNARFSIEDSSDVSLVDCPGLPALSILDSRVTIADCTIPVGATNALYVGTGSDVTMDRVRIEGASGGGVASPAVYVREATVTVTGTSVLTGGPNPTTPTGVVVRMDNATLRLGPAVTLATSDPQPIQGVGTVRTLPLPSTRATVSTPGVLDIRTEATPGMFVWTLLDAPKPPTILPNTGTLWFAPDAFVAAMGVIPLSGVQLASLPFPVQPTGSAVVVQAVAWDGVSTLVVGGAARVMVD